MSATTAIDLAAVKQRQQATWASGDFAEIATLIVPMAEQLCDAADLRAGWDVLDVATGSGNAAIAAARLGCDVVGIDYVPALLERGRERATAERLAVELVEGDAEALPFADGSFDAVVSVVGSMFAPDHRRAAAEILRVCRPGGTIALASWAPDGFIGALFRTVASHVPPPPGVASPMLWGDERHLAELFGTDVDWTHERPDVHVPVPVGRGVRRDVRPLLRADAEGRRGRGPCPGGRISWRSSVNGTASPRPAPSRFRRSTSSRSAREAEPCVQPVGAPVEAHRPATQAARGRTGCSAGPRALARPSPAARRARVPCRSRRRLRRP